jgi:hypothetical protein
VLDVSQNILTQNSAIETCVLIQQWRQHAEPVAQHVQAAVGMARGQDQFDRRHAIQHSARVRYEKLLARLVLGTHPVQIRSATHASGYATVALAVRSRGARALGVDLLGAAQPAIENSSNGYVRPERTT